MGDKRFLRAQQRAVRRGIERSYPATPARVFGAFADPTQKRRWERWFMAGKKADVNRVFHALGDPTRRAILEKLSEGPVSVSRLAEPLDVTLAAVVQHLQVLEESGLVRTEKTGRSRTCRIEPAGLSVAEQWIGDRRSMGERRLDRLGDLPAEPVRGLTGPDRAPCCYTHTEAKK